MPLMTNLHKAASGKYFYRRAVPERLRAAVGKREIWIALHTADGEEAKRRQPAAHQQANEILDRSRRTTAGQGSATQPGEGPTPGTAVPSLSVATINEMARGWRDKRIAESLSAMTFINPSATRPDAIQFGSLFARRYRHRALDGEIDALSRIEARRCLSEAGLTPDQIPDGSPEFRLLCYAIMLAMADWEETATQWLSGNTNYFPTQSVLPLPPGLREERPIVFAPAPNVGIAPATQASPATPAANVNGSGSPRGHEPLQQVVDTWLNEKVEMSPKTRHECQMVLRRLSEVVGGNPPIGSVDKVRVVQLQEALLAMPRSLPAADRRLPILQIAEKYKGLDIQRVRPETVRKQITLLQSFFEWAKEHEFIDENFAKGLKPKKGKRGIRRRVPFSSDDLQAIFNSPIYTGCYSPQERLRLGHQIIRDEYFWLPLLGTFQGGRLEELGSLLLSEIKREEGILYLELDVLEIDEEDSERDEAMKSFTSLRVSPVHPMILACGFEAYVEELRGRGETRLFPNLRPDRFGKYTALYSKWFGRFLTRLAITERRKVFHSLRHNFKAACRRANLREDVHDRLTGHRNDSVGRQYGEDIPMCVLAEAMQKVQYPELDLSHVYAQRS